MPADILAAGIGLGPIAAAVGLIALFGRDTDANHHTIDDYKPTTDPGAHIQPTRQPGRWTHLDRQTTADILPPAPPGTDAGGSPIYRQAYVDHLFAGFDAAAVAAQVLRDLGEQARKAVTP
ncbi:hypothetical protein AB0N38_26400 [Micromonospora aurantiaca]|uniref:hypothetical protein n=1 Tax=Micromonospora aurantiaca (nom. illeg.) TaxID=47850 RepID=UPI00341B3900